MKTNNFIKILFCFKVENNQKFPRFTVQTDISQGREVTENV